MGLAARDLTAGQAELARIVGKGLAKTVTEAAEKAGMNRSTAGRNLHHNDAVQRAIAVHKAEKRDSARSIRQKAQGKLSIAVETETDAQVLTIVARGMADVEEKVGLEDEAESPRACLDQWNDKMRRLVRAIYAHALAGRTCPWVQDMVPVGAGVRDGTLCQPECTPQVDTHSEGDNEG